MSESAPPSVVRMWWVSRSFLGSRVNSIAPLRGWHLCLDLVDVLATPGPRRLATNVASDGSAHSGNPFVG
ncbi:hypothetical protein HMPREF9622_01538 [Cutibacterium modestum HL037PA3]|nr:hypothetical protein HMPREF9622_01538 [Cutibacterium modestum HL037PA3]